MLADPQRAEYFNVIFLLLTERLQKLNSIIIIPPGVFSSWGSWDLLPLLFYFSSVDRPRDLGEQGDLGSDFHWNYAAGWGIAW